MHPKNDGPAGPATAARSRRRRGRTPSHIVVFREVRETRNVDLLSQRIASIRQRRHERTHNALALLAGDDGAVGEVLHDLGIAAVDLGDEERAALERDDAVEAVLANEVSRSPLEPPPRPAGGADGGTAARSGEPGSGPHPAERASRPGELTWALELLGMPAAARRLTGRGVKVALLDSGVDASHPDIAGRLDGGSRVLSFVDGEDATDFSGHGTHVAGIIAGRLEAPHQYGVAPECNLYVAKVLDRHQRAFDAGVLQAIQWALDQGVRVINLSLARARQAGEEVSLVYERVAQRLLSRADGALLIAAAGNSSRRDIGRLAPVGSPAACPSVLGVAAIDRDGGVAWFSNGQVDAHGTVDIAAPGVRVGSALPYGRFGLRDGTSAAAPHVAGVAALLFERHPGATPRQVWAALARHASRGGLSPADAGAGVLRIPPVGGGLDDVAGTHERALPSVPTVAPGSTAAEVGVVVTCDDDFLADEGVRRRVLAILEARGLGGARVLERLGIVTGRVRGAEVRALADAEHVLGVELDSERGAVRGSLG